MSYRTGGTNSYSQQNSRSHALGRTSSQGISRSTRRITRSGTTAVEPWDMQPGEGTSMQDAASAARAMRAENLMARRYPFLQRGSVAFRQQYGTTQSGAPASVAGTLRPQDSISNAGAAARDRSRISGANAGFRQQQDTSRQRGVVAASGPLPSASQLVREAHGGCGHQGVRGFRRWLSRRSSTSETRSEDEFARDMQRMRLANEESSIGTPVAVSPSRFCRGRRRSISGSTNRIAAAIDRRLMRSRPDGTGYDSSTTYTYNSSRPRRSSDVGSSAYSRRSSSGPDLLARDAQRYRRSSTNRSGSPFRMSSSSSGVGGLERYGRHRSTSGADYPPCYPSSDSSSTGSGIRTHYPCYYLSSSSQSSRPSSSLPSYGTISSNCSTRFPPCYPSDSSISGVSRTSYPSYGTVSSGSCSDLSTYPVTRRGSVSSVISHESLPLSPYAEEYWVRQRFGACYNPKAEEMARNAR